MLTGNCYRHSGPNKVQVDWASWVKPHPGVDFPREPDWMEVKRLFGGAIMAVGMN